MAIKKFNQKPATNISTWLYERDKQITPNPLKPSKKETIKDKKIDVKNLAEILTESHGTHGKINKLIDEVNKIPILTKRVIKLESDTAILKDRILRLQTIVKNLQQRYNRSQQRYNRSQQQYNRLQSSTTTSTGGRTGGNVQSMRVGGRFTKPVITSREEIKQKLINEILDLQNNG